MLLYHMFHMIQNPGLLSLVIEVYLGISVVILIPPWYYHIHDIDKNWSGFFALPDICNKKTPKNDGFRYHDHKSQQIAVPNLTMYVSLSFNYLELVKQAN